MFENILGQQSVEQLARDIRETALAPSMLFSGPAGTGKGSTALELGRILSCESPGAPWNCPCPACSLHRTLSHTDMLLLGPRNFSAEITASREAFLREPNAPSAKLLYIRAVRKLAVRFSPVLWEDDPKLSKINGTLGSLHEELEEFTALPLQAAGSVPDEKAEKLSLSLAKLAFKLESDGISDSIPIGHIRRASYWSRLAPSGRRKLVIIENADRMQDGARNSLLKILEEPPDRVNILLTSTNPGALLPTIRSRLRPYRFYRRDQAVETDVIRRVFRDPGGAEKNLAAAVPGEGVLKYLESFMPVPGEELYPLAAFFTASAAAAAIHGIRERGKTGVPEVIVALGKYAAPLAEAAGLGRPSTETKGALQELLKRTSGFEVRSLFSQFLGQLQRIVSECLRLSGGGPEGIPVRDLWNGRIRSAETAVSTYNQNPALVSERLFVELRDGLSFLELGAARK
ncbi:DNA polymerase III [Breznakiella homolactica]|uniref:DNA polymerase III n=1 Tax=Breznakiella homolactica TaxID=2798577 RepID=A0A7T7XKZ5_9SPIR|nr:DNA polymerase III [Breznakiella homolactica]QQO08230.1 DNA polymerase III [Breznakiella homolactica]